MVTPSRSGPPWRERGVLALGLVSAGVLAVAAFLPANDPEVAGRTALAQLAARTEQAVVAEWERMLRDPAPIAPAASVEFGSDGKDPEALGMPRRSEEPETDGARESDDLACAVLLAEAERVELVEGDLEGALELVDEALGKRPSRWQRYAGALSVIQLAGRLGDRERVTKELHGLLGSQHDASELDLACSELVLRAVLAARALVGDELCSVFHINHALDRWYRLAGTEQHGPRIERIGTERPWYAVVGNERLEALCERVLALPPCEGSTTLSVDHGGTRALFAKGPQLAATRALETFVGKWPEEPGSDDWNLIPVGDDVFARYGNTLGPWRGFFVARDDLGVHLLERLRAAELLPEGVAVDFRGTDTELGAQLNERVALADDRLGFVLRHRDPGELVRSVSRRQGWMRAALLVMAVFAAGAGVLMARTLRRERRLAELKTTFIANVSHELRTPLASILLMAENLEAGRAQEPATQAKYHALIRREAVRLARLVDDVLDFSRLERGKALEVRVEEVETATVVDEWCQEARAWAAQHGLELVLDVRALPERVLLDRDALRRALFNLLDNARKHSGSKSVTLGAATEGGALVLRVADSGRGILHTRRASVFEPFEREEGPGRAPGAGLGLAIVHAIVRAHGGTIAIRDPEVGSGTVFEIRLPLARGREEET